jgi:hypothetical protein
MPLQTPRGTEGGADVAAEALRGKQPGTPPPTTSSAPGGGAVDPALHAPTLRINTVTTHSHHWVSSNCGRRELRPKLVLRDPSGFLDEMRRETMNTQHPLVP